MNGVIDHIKTDIITACRILSQQGLVQGFGHVSARVPNSDRFILTPRVSLELVTGERLLVLDLNGKVVDGAETAPFEAPLHAAILRARPEVHAVARIHARKANYFGATDRKLEPIHNHGSFFFGGVPVFPKTDLISTLELGQEVAAALGQKPAILLRGNGQVTVGKSVPEAIVIAVYLEETADIYYGALQIGRPLLLSSVEAGSRKDEILPHVDLTRAWDFFRAKIEPR